MLETGSYVLRAVKVAGSLPAGRPGLSTTELSSALDTELSSALDTELSSALDNATAIPQREAKPLGGTFDEKQLCRMRKLAGFSKSRKAWLPISKLEMPKQTKTLTILVFLLVAFGLLVLLSAGVVEGQKKFNSAYYYFFHQLINGVLIGGGLYFLFSKISYRNWKKGALPILLFALFLMLAVFIPQLGLAAKGATRWLNLRVFSFQPSEVLKLALIIYFAAWFSGRSTRDRNWSYSLTPFLAVFIFSALLLASQPDMGTLGIVTLIAVAMFFFAGGGLRYFLGLSAVMLVGFFGMTIVSSYQFDRILAFVNRFSDPRGISYHINQALLAIGQGGIWGVGYGQSQQKLGFLPEPVGDSIFAIVVEELGLVGAGVLLALFMGLIFYLVNISLRVDDRFGQLLVLGVAVWIAGQAFINMAAISGLLPLTGITLPFISYGGSSLAVLMAGLGIVANVAKNN